MTTLKLDKIYKKYPNATHYSVEDFSIDIKDKEFIVFVGPSGCGKSTMGKSVIRLIEPTEGKVILDGQDFTSLKGKELQDRKSVV